MITSYRYYTNRGDYMRYIKNRDDLLSHGNKDLRKDALDIIDYALHDSDPYIQVQKLVSLEGNLLRVGELQYDLSEMGSIYILGAGKATYPIAKALDDILGNRISDGVITCKYGQEGSLKHSNLFFANHPVPDQAGVESSIKIMEIAKKTKAKDIVFSCITGGSTSLMPLPVDGLNVEDLRITYTQLLRSGANIVEMNAVRKHLCKIKGGRLAQAIHPEAEIINLTVSDVIGDMLDYITCPTVPDTSTFDNARATMEKYELWDKVPESVNKYLKNATEKEETPKDLSDHLIHNFIIVKGDAPCVGAETKAKELGYNTMILSTMIEGESREVGTVFAAIAKELVMNNRPLQTPCAIIGGGETTVKIVGESGQGGPNQQFALSASTWIEDSDNIVIAGIDTDGTDGASDLAGAIVDGSTMNRARKMGISIFEYIEKYNDTPALKELGDGLFTGATGTNVNDLKIILVK